MVIQFEKIYKFPKNYMNDLCYYNSLQQLINYSLTNILISFVQSWWPVQAKTN